MDWAKRLIIIISHEYMMREKRRVLDMGFPENGEPDGLMMEVK